MRWFWDTLDDVSVVYVGVSISWVGLKFKFGQFYNYLTTKGFCYFFGYLGAILVGLWINAFEGPCDIEAIGKYVLL